MCGGTGLAVDAVVHLREELFALRELWDVQTRDESGELRFFKTFAEAYSYAKAHTDVWKLSFSLPTGERVRLVRLVPAGAEGRSERDQFVLEQMISP
jgi:hypothetical protein